MNLRNLWMRISESAPNKRNSPHYNHDHGIWDRVFSCGDPDALAAVCSHRARAAMESHQDLMITALAGSGHVLFTANLGSLVTWLGIELSARIGIWFPRIAGDRVSNSSYDSAIRNAGPWMQSGARGEGLIDKLSGLRRIPRNERRTSCSSSHHMLAFRAANTACC